MTASVAVCAGFNVSGTVTPLTLNPFPVAATLEICTAALPELVSTTFCVALPPVATLPKATLPGLAASVPVVTVVPLPASEIVAVGWTGSLLVMAMLPLALPAIVGANVTVVDRDCPAGMVLGVVIPLMVNSAPLSVITDTVKSDPPVFDSPRLSVLLLPTETLPKFKAVPLTASCGCGLKTVPVRLTT